MLANIIPDCYQTLEKVLGSTLKTNGKKKPNFAKLVS